ncbi:MAG: hypothetical protein AB1716_09235, partial [Planctomycetota bacterium]
MRWAILGTLALVLAAPAWGQTDTPPNTVAAQFQAAFPGVILYHEDGVLASVFGVPFGYGPTAEQSAADFVERYSEMFGVPAEDLVGNWLESIHGTQLMPEDGGGYRFTLLAFAQMRDGLPVFRADLRLTALNQPGYPLTWAGPTLYPLGDFRVAPGAVENANLAAAHAAAQAAVPGVVFFEPAEPVIWAGMERQPDSRGPRVALVFEGHNEGTGADQPVRHLFVADAATGAIVYSEDRIYEMDIVGTTHGIASPSIPNKAAECLTSLERPLPYLTVSVTGGNSTFSDLNGDFTIPHGGVDPVNVSASLATGGRWFYVYQGASFLPVVTPPGPVHFLFDPNDTEFERAQVNAYLEANRVRDWVLVQAPNYPSIYNQTSPFRINVNINNSCNAFYNGSSINFYKRAGSCNNTGFSAVVHHEYGHHVVAKGGSGQGAYGEGMSDCCSALLADDPVLAYGFYQNQCNTGIRNAQNNCNYVTTGCSTCGSAIHTCGQLLSGCVWNTRTALRVTNPTTYLAIISRLTVNSVPMHGNVTTITPVIAQHFLTLDDTDGNIYNGTPHLPEICQGFGSHNMPCPVIQGALTVTPATDLASTGNAGGPFTPGSIDYTVRNTGGQNMSYEVTKTQPWVSLTNAAGTLSSGQTATVTVSINANANTLGAGVYNDTVSFTNTTNHTGDTTRSVQLTVLGGLRGDLNCDGAVNFDDINPFVLALSDPAGYAVAYP